MSKAPSLIFFSSYFRLLLLDNSCMLDESHLGKNYDAKKFSKI